MQGQGDEILPARQHQQFAASRLRRFGMNCRGADQTELRSSAPPNQFRRAIENVPPDILFGTPTASVLPVSKDAIMFYPGTATRSKCFELRQKVSPAGAAS